MEFPASLIRASENMFRNQNNTQTGPTIQRKLFFISECNLVARFVKPLNFIWSMGKPIISKASIPHKKRPSSARRKVAPGLSVQQTCANNLEFGLTFDIAHGYSKILTLCMETGNHRRSSSFGQWIARCWQSQMVPCAGYGCPKPSGEAGQNLMNGLNCGVVIIYLTTCNNTLKLSKPSILSDSSVAPPH